MRSGFGTTASVRKKSGKKITKQAFTAAALPARSATAYGKPVKARPQSAENPMKASTPERLLEVAIDFVARGLEGTKTAPVPAEPAQRASQPG
ncbi:MAG TPA: hypothetical protein VHD39_02120 [Acidimicrobiales bacterium]|nr:hypothetical protein [Acidimicrobiales bacterium]